MTGINLIPAHRLAARQRRVWRGRCAVTCAGYAAVVAAVTIGARAVTAGGGDSVAGQLDAAAADVDRSAAALTHVRADLDAAESLLRSTRAIAEQPDWSTLLALLAAKADGQVVLKGFAVRPKDPPAPAAPRPPAARGAVAAKPPAPPPDPTVLVSISGAGTSQAAASQYALRLEGTGLFGRVALLDTNREPFGERAAVSFRIECTLGEPAAGRVTAAEPGPGRRDPAGRPVATGGEP